MAKLIGTGPNQVPTNGDLGSMAFEDKKNYATVNSSIHQPYRNIIINGDMSIAQRGTSTASITSGNTYPCVDRFAFESNSMGTWTVSQDTDVPAGQGFSKSMKFDCTVADATPAAADYLQLQTRFEGQNLQYLKFGTSNAQQLTLSFWVKSNKTGTYNVTLYSPDSGKFIGANYTINSASTWEKKTVTYIGNTSNTFDNDNLQSLRVVWFLGAGSNLAGTLRTSWTSFSTTDYAAGQTVNLADSTANEWYITGVQLEAGTTASDFEFLPYDVNLQRCYRYYQNIVSGNGATFGNAFYYSSTLIFRSASFFVQMRAVPSLDQNSGIDYYEIVNNGGADGFDDLVLNTGGRTTNRFFEIFNNTDMSGTAGHAGLLRGANASSFISFDAEL